MKALDNTWGTCAGIALAMCVAACSPKPGADATSKPQAAPAAVAAAQPAAAQAEPEPGSVPVQPPALPEEQQRALMAAIFQGAYDPAKDGALTVVRKGEETERTLWTYMGANTLPDGRTAVIVNSVRANEEGNSDAGHGEPGTLNVYLLRRDGDAWQVERHENVSTMGSHGTFSDVTWLPLGDGKPGFMIGSGGTWQGSTILLGDVFALDDTISELGSFKLASDNSGGCPPDGTECWDVAGALRIAATGQSDAGYRDLLIEFKDRRYTQTEDKKGNVVEHPKSTSRQSARYHFDGKQYVLVSGTNPVPEF